MSGSKFYVYGRNRWREIDLTTGRVAGWGAVRYLSVRRGKLEVAKKDAVLRGLKALSAGNPISVQDGPQLSQFRNATQNIEATSPGYNKCENQHCCQNNPHPNKDAKFNNLSKPGTHTVAVQCAISSASYKVPQITVNKEPSQTIQQSDYVNQKSLENGKTLKKSEKMYVLSSSSNVSTSDVSTCDSEQTNGETQRVKSAQHESCKELLISEEDILLIRRFIENDDDNIFGVDLERFDSDNAYKCIVFYKLNPLVNVARSKRIANMLNQKPTLSDSFKDFMKHLGLQSVDEVSQASSHKYRMRARVKQMKCDSYERDNNKGNNKKNLKFKRAKKPNTVLGENINKVVIKNPVSGRLIKSVAKGTTPKKKTVNAKVHEVAEGTEVTKEKASLQRKQLEGEGQTVTTKRTSSRRVLEKVEASTKRNEHEVTEHKSHENESMQQKQTEKGKKNSKNNKNVKKSIKLKQNAKQNEILERKETAKAELTKNKENISIELDGASGSDVGNGRSKEKDGTSNMPRLAVVPARRSAAEKRQPYTTSEDAVLLQWVRGPGRARFVNGNRIWREFQPIYHNKTGRFRSWHSLRNRYLRSLLPTLGRRGLALSADEAARLRAAAAVGKKKHRGMELDPIVKETRVISAWSRRPRPLLSKSPSPTIDRISSRSSSSTSTGSRPNRDSDYTAESSSSEDTKKTKKIDTKVEQNKKKLQSSATGTSPKRAQNKVNTRTPTYSELTKRFALKHSTPGSDGCNDTDRYDRQTRTNRQETDTDKNITKRTSGRRSSNNKHNQSLSKKRLDLRTDSTDEQTGSDDDDEKKTKEHGNNSNSNKSKRSSRRQSDDVQYKRLDRQKNKEVKSSSKTKPSRDRSTDTDSDGGDDEGQDGQTTNRRSSRNTKGRHRPDTSDDRVEAGNSRKRDRRDRDTSRDLNGSNKTLRSRKNSIDRQQVGSSDDDRETNNRSMRQKSIHGQMKTDTDDIQTKNLRNSDRQERGSHRSSKGLRSRNISTDRQVAETSDDQSESDTKHLNGNRSSRRSNESSDVQTKKLRNTDRNERNPNLSNSNKRPRKDSTDGQQSQTDSDSEEERPFEKKLRSSRREVGRHAKADSGRPRTRRLFNPNAF